MPVGRDEALSLSAAGVLCIGLASGVQNSVMSSDSTSHPENPLQMSPDRTTCRRNCYAVWLETYWGTARLAESKYAAPDRSAGP